MNDKELREILMFFKGCYPWCWSELNGRYVNLVIDDYVQKLAHYDFETVKKAAMKAVRENTTSFLPTTEAIIKSIEE